MQNTKPIDRFFRELSFYKDKLRIILWKREKIANVIRTFKLINKIKFIFGMYVKNKLYPVYVGPYCVWYFVWYIYIRYTSHKDQSLEIRNVVGESYLPERLLPILKYVHLFHRLLNWCRFVYMDIKERLSPLSKYQNLWRHLI